LSCVETKIDDYVMGSFGNLNSATISIKATYCDKKCKMTPDDTKEKIRGLIMNFGFIDYFVDAYDYKDPIKATLKNQIIQISPNF